MLCPFPDLSFAGSSRRVLISGAAVLALLSVSMPVSGATSSVVGFYQVNVPAGNSLWVSGLVAADEFQAAAAAVTADTDGKALVSFAAPGWTAGQFGLHYAEPQSGTCAGLAIDILSNTADTLKLNATPAEANLSAGMTFIVRKHATLAGLLPDGGGFVPFNDTLSTFGPTGQQTNYFFNSFTQKWIDVLGADSSNVVVRPGQGIVIQVSAPLTMLLGKGEAAYVKATPTKIRANANVPNLLGPVNPLGGTATLVSLGMLGSLQVFNDSVVILTPGSLAQSGTYLSVGPNFIDGLGQNADGTQLPGGAGVVVNVNAVKNISLAPVTVTP